MGGLSLGGLTTLRTGEKPSETAVQEMLSVWGPHSVAEESRLSQILEVNPLPKYNLTAKACLGILRRAERRGKDLPERLKQVLLMQSASGVMGVSHDVAGTLRAQEHGHQPTVLDMSHACDVIRECGEQAPALQARMGTGGNQVPLTYGIGNGQACEASIMAEELAQTLNTMHDAQAVMCPDAARAILYQPKSAMEENWAASETKNALRAGESKVSHAVMCEDVSHALRAKAACAYREDAETYPVQNMVVRRLTPMECERLQGFPDYWTDIGEWTDEKGKKHKDADSPRYKALGNSIALPFWEWMLRRMARYLPEGATLGSLFDGIGGFPLIWERIHGEGTARWASEIEQFPIAVTKIRFPEGREYGI